MIRFYNTLTGRVEAFAPIESGVAKTYHCGPTVYGRQHIGNLSMFVFTDLLRRTLRYHGITPVSAINFTDFGHLSSDADEGEDKMTKGLKREGLELTLENMHKLGQKYAEVFLEDIKTLNVDTEGITFPYASAYVKEQIEMIKTLEEKGIAYQGDGNVYFDTSKFPNYGKLGNINLEGQKEGARVTAATAKRNPTDFVLWKGNPNLGWDSPWGKGFPGWHIECSAMIRSVLGDQIDIHTGGIEHIPVHHNNEIAQSESATGKSPFARFWIHRAHIQIGGEKIAKSEGNVVYLSDILEKNISPLALRYFFFTAHYRTPLNFSWEALEGAENAYRRLKAAVSMFKKQAQGEGSVTNVYKEAFMEVLNDDLNTPEALAVVWKVAKNAGDDISYEDAYTTLLDFDRILGLNLDRNEYEVTEIPSDVLALLDQRKEARDSKDFVRSDELRERIKELGYDVKDGPDGQSVVKA